MGYYIKETTLNPGSTHVLGLNHKTAYRLPGNGVNAVFNFLCLQPEVLYIE